MDGQVTHTGVRVFRNHYAGRQVRSAVALGVVRYRQGGKVRICLDHLVGRALFYHHGFNRVPAPGADIVSQHERQLGAGGLEKPGHEVAVPVQADQHRIIPSLDLFEKHGFTALVFPGNTGQFKGRVHFAFYPYQVIMLLQEGNIGLQVDEIAFSEVHDCFLYDWLSDTRCLDLSCA